jgi:hypothetical protein
MSYSEADLAILKAISSNGFQEKDGPAGFGDDDIKNDDVDRNDSNDNYIEQSSISKESDFKPKYEYHNNSNFSMNTGPKGVLNDHRNHVLTQNIQRQAEIDEYNRKLNSSALSTGWLQRQIELEENDPELAEINRDRLLNLMNPNNNSESLHGSVNFIDHPEQLLDLVDDPKNSESIIILFTLPYSKYEDHFIQLFVKLSKKHVYNQFIVMNRGHEKFFGKNLDPDLYPSILAYRNGDLVGNLIGFLHTDFWSDRNVFKLDQDHLENFLYKENVL